MKVEPHTNRFRHDTVDEAWLPEVGEKKWIVLMRDKRIGKRLLELDALLWAGVKSFALVSGGLPDSENAQIIIKALPRIFKMVEDHNFPFIAKIQKDSSVELWKTDPMIHKGIKVRYKK